MASPMPSDSPTTPQPRRRRLSSFHRPQRSPAAPMRTPLRPMSANRRLSTMASPTPRKAPPSTHYAPTPRTPATAQHHRRRSSRRLSRRPPMSHEEIAAMYSATIKLCQDNKINARNTWTLNLIDYMPMLFKTSSSATEPDVAESRAPARTDDTNFQLAGVTLDAGVRIYCSRVDSVHTNAFKVLGGLSRTGAGGGGDDADGDMGDDAGGDGEGGRRRARRTGRATLENNMANITSQKLETDLAVDPLFQKMSAAFDEGGARGMLLNNLPVGPRGQVIFDSGEMADNLVASTVPETAIDVYDVSVLLPPSPPGDGEVICGAFLGFFRAKKDILDRAATATGSAGLAESASQAADLDPAFDMPDSEPDFDYSSGDLQNAGAMGVFAAPEESAESAFTQEGFEDEDDVNMFTSADEPPTRNSLASNASFAFAARRGSLDLVEAGVVLSETSEYSFFDTSTMSGWAGPQHWRFRATQATSHTESTDGMSNDRKPKRPRGKTAMLLDFSSEAPKINFKKEFAQGKGESSYHLSKTVREAFSEKKVTLPVDHHFSVRSLASLFLKPRTYVRPKRSRGGTPRYEAQNAADDWYDFDNDCDNENFCPDNGDFPGDNRSGEGNMSFTTEMDLIPEPTRVEKIDINYAKVAKKVDVRQLKSGMWSQLCGEGRSPRASQVDRQNALPEEDGNHIRESESDSNSADIRNGTVQTLQEVVTELPAFVPKTSLPDVSLPYVFICLLHLANEKTLEISQANNGSLRDLVITSGSQDTEE